MTVLRGPAMSFSSKGELACMDSLEEGVFPIYVNGNDLGEDLAKCGLHGHQVRVTVERLDPPTRDEITVISTNGTQDLEAMLDAVTGQS